jgi:hypothetical protein
LSHSLRLWISVCISKKRFLWGPLDVDSDSVHVAAVLSLTIEFPILHLGVHVGRRCSSEDPYTPGLEQVCYSLGQV